MSVNTAVSEMTREQFREVFGETLKVNESLSRFTSARVGGPGRGASPVGVEFQYLGVGR